MTGDLISSMDGHKKPYEILLLGRCSMDEMFKESSRESQKSTSVKTLPKTFAFISIPCSLHSKKPPLQGSCSFFDDDDDDDYDDDDDDDDDSDGDDDDDDIVDGDDGDDD
jgi:hypothetical protein